MVSDRQQVLTSLRQVMQLQLGAMQHRGDDGLQKVAKPGGSFPDLRLLPIPHSLLQQQGRYE